MGADFGRGRSVKNENAGTSWEKVKSSTAGESYKSRVSNFRLKLDASKVKRHSHELPTGNPNELLTKIRNFQTEI